MKTALAIICSCLFVGSPFLLAQAAPPCIKQNHACCHCDGKMNCCAAKSSPDSQPAPAVPAQSGTQSQFLFLAPAIVIWNLPENEAGSISSVFVSPLTASGAPLYARDCARLI
jgi:hypothetical protein